ncbi:radical SAM protein [Pseudodesulfovibrio senegalensis]|uniref:Radical SAM protein n=1 Tax=Pseudodesulfovibrio senegalensis TaxID=1721087 RepID=A0A6N6N5B4_9BACT|nr:radical SAM protein [Pseudodesulfovibrio senegalensis]KAB1442931.1 radical SAM protein [Pseudodesulfovibrio senegalensis]
MDNALSPFPRTLEWEVTSRCNLACSHCISPYYDRMLGPELDRGQVLHAIDGFADAGIGHVHFFGGEPTFHPEFAEILSALDGRGISVSMTTNGTLLEARGLWDALCGLKHLMGISFSFEDIQGERQDRVRGAGFFRTACRAVEQAAARLPDVPLTVAFTLNRPALMNLSPWEIIRFFSVLGAGKVLFQDLAVPHNARPGLARLAYGAQDWFDFAHALFDREAQLGCTLPFVYEIKPLVAEYLNSRPECSAPVVRYGCQAMSCRVRLLSDGHAVPCLAVVGWPDQLQRYLCHTPTVAQEPLAEILGGPLYAQFNAHKLWRSGQGDGSGAKSVRGSFMDSFMEPCRTCPHAGTFCNPCVFGRISGQVGTESTCGWVWEAMHGQARHHDFSGCGQ